MGRNWWSKEAAERYYRLEGFYVGFEVCGACGFTQDSSIYPGTECFKHECGRCGKMESVFRERETDDDDDEAEQPT